ncbi:Tagatose-bisphosphate aldolase [Tepidanaerobacter acetatoxydans Re1]|uniref:Tagatose-bisphosphate aldolase n=1 Tax=Tepidanaerobacter acetatoxydans (strain DSM 21804 / JCM 16047 / Re1) TaxID=1209989 RepID=F4LTE2_TEPAE|nr:class II fructose-bisphosphate aldolase [Tepidanaerobacter acetatoxydans]AEE90473.1 Tagatose-bisphosphate aldolase [Tepidanaerobacter acetatoxydans Re1]CCP24975.1 Tagatose-bisphosphate aldolase [Tepidanaerobacter acetatoxydans Re1]
MLVRITEMLKYAKKEGYAVPALAAVDELTSRAAIEAAERMKSPVILLCMENGNKDLCYFGKMINDFAIRAQIPVALVYDHTTSFESAIKGIRAGFNCIMVDRSQIPYKENVAQVKELVRIAHAANVEVESELGHVGMEGSDAQDSECALTVPDEALKFVEETDVDCLAVAIGTSHGVYKGKPKLRFDLLEKIAQKVTVPLVLHGGSGTGDENLAKTCRKGICKVNIVNDLYRSAYNALISDGMEGNRIYNLFPVLSKGYIETAMHFMKVLGSAGKAI